jgi:Protein kinase domain
VRTASCLRICIAKLSDHISRSCTGWPFQLLAKVPVEDKTYSYAPQSDFSLFFRKEPYLLVAVQSDKDGSDRRRMLLQAACATRLRNALHCNEQVPLIVTAMYITTDAKLERYFLFQSSDWPEIVCSLISFYVIQYSQRLFQVHYTKEVFDLQQPQELFTAVFEMYNLAFVIQRETRSLKNVQKHITDIDQHVKEEYEENFTSRKRSTTGTDMSNSPTWTRTGQSDDPRADRLYDARHVSEAFTQAGFTLESTSNSDGWKPLNKVKEIIRLDLCICTDEVQCKLRSTMRHGKHSDGTAVIVKLLRSRCNELSILEYLSSIDSSENHTIRLLRSFRLDVGTFIVVPKFTPLDIGLMLRRFRGKIASLGNQLIEGVGFMHRSGIAHLDIKPENIVVRNDDCLFIIDFDIAVRVDGPGHLIDTRCGTHGWMAPEIGKRDGPRHHLYSPIRADLWSCGRVISYMMARSGEMVQELRILTWRLLHRNPQYRPLLPVHRQAKRKADTLASPRATKQLAL